MKTETITREIFTFEELSPEAQERAINNNRDINTDYSWWDQTYETLSELATMCEISGFEISGFDLDRAQSIALKGSIEYFDLQKFARAQPKEDGYKKLEELHTYAKSLLIKNLCPAIRSAIASTYHNGWEWEAGASFERTRYGCTDDTKVETSTNCESQSATMIEQTDKCAEACSDFLDRFKDECFKMLNNEFEYLYSEKAIKETIEANEIEFTADGERA